VCRPKQIAAVFSPLYWKRGKWREVCRGKQGLQKNREPEKEIKGPKQKGKERTSRNKDVSEGAPTHSKLQKRITERRSSLILTERGLGGNFVGEFWGNRRRDGDPSHYRWV